MQNWRYTIDLKEAWDKYRDYSHEDFDNDPELFEKMKGEITTELTSKARSGDTAKLNELVSAMKQAKHLSNFNSAWDSLYDYCDNNRIWLKTLF